MSDERKNMGMRLKAARKYLRLSQQEVADQIPTLSRSAISLIESGQRKVTADELKMLADLYQQPMAEIADPGELGSAPIEANIIARQMSKLSPQDRAEVIRFTELLLSRGTKEKP